MQIVVNNLIVSYQKSGAGPVAVLLHGWADTLNTFDSLLSDLEKHYTVIRIDLAGFGGSQPPKKSLNLLDYANFVRDTLQKIFIMPNDITLLVGHSNGGAIAIKAVSKGILKPKKLVLLASAGIREDSVRKSTVRTIAKVGKIATIILPSKYKNSIRKNFYNKIGSDYLIAENMQGTFKKIVSEDIRHDAEKIAIPTLLVYGELDMATPTLFGQFLQQSIEGSTLTVIQNADHFVHQSYSDDVYKLIREFDKS